MKKIFILAYTRQNLGDDLFIYMLLEKYPNIQFYINIEEEQNCKPFEKFSNITINRQERRELNRNNANEYDGYIYIGGSIFMEGIGSKYIITDEFLEFMKECKRQKIPFYYVSSNFGPYKSQKFFNLASETFENCSDICFRDMYSRQLFSGLASVRYAPDLIFSYNTQKIEKRQNSIGISIIDLSNRRKLISYMECYYIILEKNIKKYIEQRRDVVLFSFCKYEGDEKAIEELMRRFPNNIKEKIKVVKYDGDIEQFLSQYSKMEYFICARFHSMVLSVIMGQKCQIMSYSDKINNVIDDLQLFTGNVLNLNEIDGDTRIPLSNFKKVDSEKVADIAQRAKKQLEEVDKFLI